MNKKIFALLIVVSLLVMGCTQAQLTPKEVFQKMSDQGMQGKDMRLDFDGTMNMDITGDDMSSEVAAAQSMMQNIGFEGYALVKDMLSSPRAFAEYKIDMNGMTISLDAYIDDELIALNYPMMGKYIVFNYNDINEMISENSDNQFDISKIKDMIGDFQKTILPKVNKVVIEKIDEGALSLEKDFEFTVKGETAKANALKVVLTKENMKEVYYAMIELASTDEEIYNTIAKYNFPNVPSTFDEFKQMISEQMSREKFDEMWDKMYNSDGALDYVYYIGYDKDYNPTYLKADAKLSMSPENANNVTMDYDMSMNGKYSYDSITIEKPELTPENSINFQELSGGM